LKRTKPKPEKKEGKERESEGVEKKRLTRQHWRPGRCETALAHAISVRTTQSANPHRKAAEFSRLLLDEDGFQGSFHLADFLFLALSRLALETYALTSSTPPSILPCPFFFLLSSSTFFLDHSVLLCPFLFFFGSPLWT